MNLMHHQKPARALQVSNDWETSWPLRRLQNQLDQLFEESFESWFTPPGPSPGAWTPPVEVLESNEKLVVRAELPGVKREEIDLYLTGDSLNIAGERREQAQYQSGAKHRVERYFGRFHRRIALPFVVDRARVEARYQDGVLTVICPKDRGSQTKGD